MIPDDDDDDRGELVPRVSGWAAGLVDLLWVLVPLGLGLGLVALGACSVPKLEDLGSVDDAGSCQVLVAPGSCDDAPGLERELEAGLPCNTCVVYRCECRRRIFCKVCSVGAERTDDAWGCTPLAPAWCEDV